MLINEIVTIRIATFVLLILNPKNKFKLNIRSGIKVIEIIKENNIFSKMLIFIN